MPRPYYFKPPFLNLNNYEFNLDIVSIISKRLAKKHNIIALDTFGKILTIGMVNVNYTLIEKLEKKFKLTILPYQVTEKELTVALTECYQ